MSDYRTVDDISDEEYEDYQNNPDNWQDVTDNTEKDTLDMMYPDEDSRPDEY